MSTPVYTHTHAHTHTHTHKPDLVLQDLTVAADQTVTGSLSALPLHRGAMQAGDRVALLGFVQLDHHGHYPDAFEGRLSSSPHGSELHVDLSAYPGQSGGPLVDESGRLVGVLMGAPPSDKGGSGVRYARW